MRCLVLLALVAPGVARAQAPVPAELPPPDPVPLLVESLGPPQDLALGQIAVYGGGRGARLVDSLSCTTPCTLRVEPGARVRLRLSGAHIEPTRTDLVVPAGGLRVKMYAPSNVKTILGLLLVAMAPGAAVTGSVFTAMGAERPDARSRRHETTAGLAMLAAGSAVVVAGAVLLGANHKGVAWRSDAVRF
jgi:hypothetical protein